MRNKKLLKTPEDWKCSATVVVTVEEGVCFLKPNPWTTAVENGRPPFVETQWWGLKHPGSQIDSWDESKLDAPQMEMDTWKNNENMTILRIFSWFHVKFSTCSPSRKLARLENPPSIITSHIYTLVFSFEDRSFHRIQVVEFAYIFHFTHISGRFLIWRLFSEPGWRHLWISWFNHLQIGPQIKNQTGWWFQIFFIFTPIWGNDPFWLIFLKWVETTNQQIFWTYLPNLRFFTPRCHFRWISTDSGTRLGWFCAQVPP